MDAFPHTVKNTLLPFQRERYFWRPQSHAPAMNRSLVTLAASVFMVAPVLSQTVALFTVDQLPLFVLNGGEDQVFTGNTLHLGGQPTASGGGGEFVYAWEPADLLDDPNAPNPQLEDLDADTLFTVTVTDLLTGCVKVDEVWITVDISTGLVGGVFHGLQVFPNPASTIIRVEGQEEIGTITLRSLAGQEVLHVTFPGSKNAIVDIATLSDGMYLLTITTASGHTITHKLCKASSDF
jgi:hypothetical protein